MEEVVSLIDKNFNRFISILENDVKRDGVQNLISWLKSKDTKIAPASTKYHLSRPGGLVEHSLHVYDRLKRLVEMEYPKFKVSESGEMEEIDGYQAPYSDETIAIVALMHDISKVNFYDIQERNTKNEKGEWIKVPYYAVKDDDHRLIFDTHSINSFYMLSKFIKLTYEEELAIIHHEGAFNSCLDNLAKSNIMSAWRKSPLGMLLHQADMMATILDDDLSE